MFFFKNTRSLLSHVIQLLIEMYLKLNLLLVLQVLNYSLQTAMMLKWVSTIKSLLDKPFLVASFLHVSQTGLWGLYGVTLSLPCHPLLYPWPRTPLHLRSVIPCPSKASALRSSALPSSAMASAQPGAPIDLSPSLALSYPCSHGVAQCLGLSSFRWLSCSWLRYWDRTRCQAFLCSPGEPPLLPALASGSCQP